MPDATRAVGRVLRTVQPTRQPPPGQANLEKCPAAGSAAWPAARPAVVRASGLAGGPAGGPAFGSVACQYHNKSPRSSGGLQGGDPPGVGDPGEPPPPDESVLGPGRFFKSVRACHRKAWTLAYWPNANPQDVTFRCFKCRSWRHPGECRLWKGAQDFSRIREAVRGRNGWVYLVLTFDPKKWKDHWHAYRGGVRCWDRLRKRLVREYGPLHYIQTWERHESGWPHVNILVHNEAIAALCQGEGWKEWRRAWLEPNAVASGFGMRTWVEPMRDQDAMAGYMVKLARELVGATTKNQVPENAPRHFRRLRASRGLLPKPFKTGEYTGELLRIPIDAVGDGGPRVLSSVGGRPEALMQRTNRSESHLRGRRACLPALHRPESVPVGLPGASVRGP